VFEESTWGQPPYLKIFSGETNKFGQILRFKKCNVKILISNYFIKDYKRFCNVKVKET
jgi:hypothetical protein